MNGLNGSPRMLRTGLRLCSFCNSAEHCFTKSYKKGEEYIKSPNEFWFCQNENCAYSIKIIPFEVHSIAWDNEEFYYRRSALTDLNIEAVNKERQGEGNQTIERQPPPVFAF